MKYIFSTVYHKANFFSFQNRSSIIIISLCFAIIQCSERIIDTILYPDIFNIVMIIGVWIFNGIHIYLFILIVDLILKKTALSIILVGFISSILWLINHIKIKYLSSPLIPQDALLLKEAFESSPNYVRIFFTIITLLFTSLLIFLIYKNFKNRKLNNYSNRYPLKSRGISVLIILSVLVPAYALNYHPTFCKGEYQLRPKVCSILRIIPESSDWVGDLNKAYFSGFLMFYIAKTIDYIVLELTEKDIPYEKISSLIKKDSFTKNQNISPNIVIIMEEAFTDPRKIDNTFNNMDFSFIDRYQKSNFISPKFGNGTSNVEFEVLTGLSTRFFPGEYIYTQRIKKNIYSIPHYLTSFNYETIAIHNNSARFYNRYLVYPQLGFSKFISLDEMSYNKNEQLWASDDLIYDNIRNELDKNIGQPKFIYAITVENHAFYDDERYGKQNFELASTIPEKQKKEINTYSAGVILQNKRLNSLVEHLKTLDKPILLIVFGDHQPIMEFTIQRDKNKEALDSYSTPLMIWANYDVDLNKINKAYIPASFLGAEILKIADLPLPSYYRFIDKVAFCYNLIHPKLLSRNDNCSNEEAEKILGDYRALNFDILKGKNYTYQILMN